MCGITGYYSFSQNQLLLEKGLESAVQTLRKRGPDNFSSEVRGAVGLGHTRLSIIDTSENGHQPMSDVSGRYTLVFNGEIYNHHQLRETLNKVDFVSTSDTEVLLYHLIQEGADCLTKLNGFFAFAFYDHEQGSLLLARDRMGIKPLHYYADHQFFAFGSEMKALMQFPIDRKINHEALHWYLNLNYLPGELSMLEGVRKLLPGHYLQVKSGKVEEHIFWRHDAVSTMEIDYSAAQGDLVEVLEKSVQRRLMADVPLGSFLSGGTDSSAIVALASRHHADLSTYSIGYRDHPFFDETHYAELVAKKFKTNHTTFSLTNDDLLQDLGEIMDYIDEPFADSSAIPTYILSKHVGQRVKVALSGDGADELFGGYYKHLALNRSLQASISNRLIKGLNPMISLLPKSRSGKWSNLFRRLDRYGAMLKLSSHERYWFLSALTHDPESLLKNPCPTTKIQQFKNRMLSENPNMNDYLLTELQVLLPGDMLTKVDLMSMANSLEVRVPFLDKEVVAFARALPIEHKLKGSERKRIVQDAFREILPKELYHRSKKGFEVPLLHWMRNELLIELDDVVFNGAYLEGQGLFEMEAVLTLRKQLLSSNPGDVHGTIWALYVFQKWYKRHDIHL